MTKAIFHYVYFTSLIAIQTFNPPGILFHFSRSRFIEELVELGFGCIGAELLENSLDGSTLTYLMAVLEKNCVETYSSVGTRSKLYLRRSALSSGDSSASSWDPSVARVRPVCLKALRWTAGVIKAAARETSSHICSRVGLGIPSERLPIRCLCRI